MSPEEMSFRNLVEWDRQALLRVLNGEFASDVFTETHHRYLVKMRVLARIPKLNRTLPTLGAMKLLGVS